MECSIDHKYLSTISLLQVWFALEQMCKALGQTPAKKEKDMNPSTNTTDVGSFKLFIQKII